MSCVTEENKTAIQDMFEGDAPDKTICRALEDAERFVKKYGGTYSDDEHTMLIRYYACHLLFVWGFANRLISSGTADILESYKDLELGDNINSSSYLVEFNKLIQNQIDEFFLSV